MFCLCYFIIARTFNRGPIGTLSLLWKPAFQSAHVFKLQASSNLKGMKQYASLTKDPIIFVNRNADPAAEY